MARQFIPVIIFIVLIIGGLFGLYYYFKDDDDTFNQKYTTIALKIYSNNKAIKTGYTIQNGYHKSGNTSEEYTIIDIPMNETIYVSNLNLPEQNYYHETVEFINQYNTTKRLDIKIEKAKELILNSANIKNNLINVNVTSKNFRDFIFCLDSSYAYIFVKPYNNVLWEETNKTIHNYKLGVLEENNQYSVYSFALNYDYQLIERQLLETFNDRQNAVDFAMKFKFDKDTDYIGFIDSEYHYDYIYYEEIRNDCYNPKLSLNDDSFNFEISYELFMDVSNRDYINITFIDRDYYNNQLVESIDNKDIGAENKEFKIK
jgi:hypothetical protein